MITRNTLYRKDHSIVDDLIPVTCRQVKQTQASSLEDNSKEAQQVKNTHKPLLGEIGEDWITPLSKFIDDLTAEERWRLLKWVEGRLRG